MHFFDAQENKQILQPAAHPIRSLLELSLSEKDILHELKKQRL
jgi:hypothetical protein